ncbi:MAG: DUF3467 domain-containing protein [Methylococcaceae bacterium]|nr:DUF3467 domain-containing protein [Methylococcaceae bacterium]
MKKEGNRIGVTKTARGQGERQIKWRHDKMETSYCNVVNVISSREELTVLFGTNKTWFLDEEIEFAVELSHRILLNPYAAKRFSLLLSSVLSEYESRYGPLGLGEKAPTVH